jgi:hypothetical protein
MTNGFDELRSLGDEAFDYLKLRWASFRLATVDRLSDSAAKAIGAMIAGVVLLFALVFLMVALALWIGEMLGHYSLGFLIAGGGFLLVGVVLWLVGRRLFAGTMVRFFVDMFFTDYDYRHGTRD